MAVSLMAHRRVCLPSDREAEQSNRGHEEGEGIGLRFRRNSGGNCVRAGKSSPDEGAYLPAALGRYNQLGAGGLAEVPERSVQAIRGPIIGGTPEPEVVIHDVESGTARKAAEIDREGEQSTSLSAYRTNPIGGHRASPR